MTIPNEPHLWCVYMVRCNDNSLYTGITTDIARRLRQHNNGPGGARYTRSRRPVTMVYWESAASRSTALAREYQIKNSPTSHKQQLIIRGSHNSRQNPPDPKQP